MDMNFGKDRKRDRAEVLEEWRRKSEEDEERQKKFRELLMYPDLMLKICEVVLIYLKLR